VVRRADNDLFAVLGLAGNGPFRDENTRRASNASDRAEQRGEGRQVVGAHIEHGPGTNLVVVSGIGVPGLVPMAHHEGRSRHGFADGAFVDEFATRLQASSQESARRATDAYPLLPRGRQDAGTLLPRHRQRFLGIDVLARLDGRETDLHVGLRRGKVHHNLDVRIRQQFGHGADLLHAKLRCPGLGARGVDVAARHRFENGKGIGRRQVRRRDVPTTDDADLDAVHGSCNLLDV